MSNDPKDAVVDLLKMLKGQKPSPTSTQTIPVNTANPMITRCNGSLDLSGHELSMRNEQKSRMIGQENFTHKDSVAEEKPD